MGRPKKEIETTEPSVVLQEESVSSSGVVTVTWRLGTREYSKDIHGVDYKKLAKEFSDKVNGTVS